jgi:hypothetical protein
MVQQQLYRSSRERVDLEDKSASLKIASRKLAYVLHMQDFLPFIVPVCTRTSRVPSRENTYVHLAVFVTWMLCNISGALMNE